MEWREYEALSRRFTSLKRRFDNHPPAPDDLAEIRDLRKELQAVVQSPLLAHWEYNAGAAVLYLCAADLNNDGCDEIYLASDRGQVCVICPDLPSIQVQILPAPAFLPKDLQASHLQGFSTYVDQYQDRFVILQARSGEETRRFDVRWDEKGLQLAARAPRKEPLAGLTNNLPDTPASHNLQILEAPAGERSEFHVVARFIGTESGSPEEAIFRTPYRPTAAWIGREGIWLAEGRPRLSYLPFARSRAGLLNSEPDWDGQVSGAVNAFLYYPERELRYHGAGRLLAACADGSLCAVEPENGQLLWRVALQGIPLCLALSTTGSVNSQRLIVGFQDGRVRAYSFLPQAAHDMLLSLQDWDEALRTTAPASDQPAPEASAEVLPSIERGVSGVDVDQWPMCLRRFDISGPLKSLHVCQTSDKATGAWAAGVTYTGRLDVFDLVAGERLEIDRPSSDARICAAVGDPPAGDWHALAFAWDDGVVQWWTPRGDHAGLKCLADWDSQAGIRCLAFWQPPEGPPCLLAGCDDGWLEIYTLGEDHPRAARLLESPIRVLAILSGDRPRLAAVDSANPGFWLADLPASLASGELRITPQQVLIPHRIADLRAWPNPTGLTSIAAVCTDDRVQVFNADGEHTAQHWPAINGLWWEEVDRHPDASSARQCPFGVLPRLALFDMDEDGDLELLTACSQRMVAYRSDGIRQVELDLGWIQPIQALGAACLPDGPALLAASRTGLHALNLRRFLEEQPSSLTKGELCARADSVCARLQQISSAETDAALAGFANPVALQDARRRAMFALEDLADRIGCDELAGAAWLPAIQTLANCDDEVARRGVALLATRAAMETGTRLWWNILRMAASGSGSAVESAREVVALHLRKRYHANPLEGWRLLHHALEHGLDPGVLTCLAREDDRALVRNPSRLKLFEALRSFYQSSAADNTGVNPFERCQRANDRLRSMVNELHSPEHSDLAQDFLSRLYRSLYTLASVESEAHLKNWLRDPSAHDYLSAAMQSDQDNQHVLHAAPSLSKHLRILQGEVRRLGETYHPEDLRHLITWLERNALELDEQASEAHEKGWNVSCAWLRLLSDLLRGWCDPSGLVGRWIDRLEHDFHCSWSPRHLHWQEGELSAGFELQNTGYTPAFDVAITAIQLNTADGHLIAECNPTNIPPAPRFDPGKSISGQMVFSLPPDLSGDVVLHIIVGYTQEARSKLELDSDPFPTGELFGVDYAVEFPSSWKHYSARFEAALEAGLAFLQLERRARRSFFRACQEKLPPGQSLAFDLRLVWDALRREHAFGSGLAGVRRDHLLRALLEQISDAPPLDPLRPDDRARFEGALFKNARPVTHLFLDNMEVLLSRLVREEKDASEKALGELLEYLAGLVQERAHRPVRERLHIALGGTFLSLCMLRRLYPDFSARLNCVQADLLANIPDNRSQAAALKETVAFLQREIDRRGLQPILQQFASPPTTVELVKLCGAGLQMMQYFVLDCLVQLRQELDKNVVLPQRLAGKSIIDFFLASERQRNFFRLLWTWFSSSEKVALSLLANAEFPLEKKDWLSAVENLRFSRAYYPGVPAPAGEHRHSLKEVAGRGQALDGELLQKIRASIYFSADDVWISGYATRGPQALKSDRAASMLLRLLGALDLYALLTRLEKDGLLEHRLAKGELGDIFSLRTPLWAEALRRAGVLETMRRRANTSQGDWYPPELLEDMHTRQPLFPRHYDKTRAQRVTGLIDPDQLPAVARDFSAPAFAEELELFWNFYGLAGFRQQPGQRRERWKNFIALAKALQEFRQPQAGEARAAHAFNTLQEALDAAPPDVPFPLPQAGILLDGLPTHLIAIRYLAFNGPVLSGLSQRLLFVLIPDGTGWDLPETQELVRRVNERRQAFLDAEEEWYGRNMGKDLASSPPTPAERRLLPIFLVLSAAKAFSAGLSGSLERQVILDLDNLFEILTAEAPVRRFERLLWEQVGRWTYSPYQSSGPLDIHSKLFVGRQKDLRRILENVARRPFIILGSRKIGKTSLLLRVHRELGQEARHGCLPLWLGICRDAPDFFERLRNCLHGLPEPDGSESAARLGTGEDPYKSLAPALDLLRRRSGRTPVLLLDELDILLSHDQEQGQDGRLIKLLRDLTQAPQPPFSLIATGHGFVYMARSQNQSAFYNFGEIVHLGAETRENLGLLIDLLENYDVKFAYPADDRWEILEGAYHVPYLVQEICHGLLKRLDDYPLERLNPATIDSVDVRAEVRRCEDNLYQILFEKPEVYYPGSVSQEELHRRVCILLLTCVLSVRAETVYINQPYHAPTESLPRFTARDALRYLEDFVSQGGPGTRRQIWPWSAVEIDRLLDQMCMTLAIASEDSEQGRQYYFPNDLLPRLLYNRFHREWAEQRRIVKSRGERIEDMPLVIELANAIQEYRRLYHTSGDLP